MGESSKAFVVMWNPDEPSRYTIEVTYDLLERIVEVELSTETHLNDNSYCSIRGYSLYRHTDPEIPSAILVHHGTENAPLPLYRPT